MKLTLLLLALINLHILFAARTAKWNQCNCRWDDWASWSTCSKKCNGGTQKRSRSVWSYVTPGCNKFEDCATPGSGWQHRDCNEICFNGGTYQYYCRCPPRWKGSCCDEGTVQIFIFWSVILFILLLEYLTSLKSHNSFNHQDGTISA